MRGHFQGHTSGLEVARDTEPHPAPDGRFKRLRVRFEKRFSIYGGEQWSSPS